MPADLHHRLAVILSAPEFQRDVAVAQGPSIWTQLRDWIVKQLEAILRPLFARLANGSTLEARIVVGVAALAAAVLAIVLVRVLLRNLRRGARATDPSASALLPTSADEVAARAAASAERGDFVAAIKLLFVAALRRFDARGLVAYDPARTPGEYGRIVRRLARDLAEPFTRLSSRYVIVAYAETGADRTAWEEALLAYREIDLAR